MNFEDNFNQRICSGNKTASTCTSDTRIYVEKPPQGEEEKTTVVDQPVHASFTMSNLGTESSLEHLEIYNTLSMLPTGNNNNNHLEEDYNKAEISQFMSPSVISNVLSDHNSKQHQTWKTSRHICSQQSHQKSAQSDTVCLSKLFVYQNCLF